MNAAIYAIVIVPIAPVRKSPNHRDEMTNQLFFGEALIIINSTNEAWVKVQSLYDQYTGWLTPTHITIVDKAVALRPCQTLASELLNRIVFDKKIMNIPQAASLRNLNNGKGYIEHHEYTFPGKAISTETVENCANTVIDNAMQWLNAPYLWGGKTILGVDCSGFSQTMYKLIGISLPRDARQQAEKGEFVTDLHQAQPADLAFFDDKDEIVHVGILLNATEIIHAAGKVRIDGIDNYGIINVDTGKPTHSLRLIRRYIR